MVTIIRKFKDFIAKYRLKLTVPITILLSIVGIINLYFVLEITPVANDECLWSPKKITKDSSAIFFDLVKFEGVTWNAGIRDGDQLLKINDVKITNTFIATITLNRIHSGDSATYLYSRDGRTFETKVEIKELIQFPFLALSLIALIWLLVGHIVIVAKPDGKPQVLFYRVGVFLSLYATLSLIIGNFANNPIFEMPWLVVLIDQVWTIGGFFAPFVFLHFFWVFPVERKLISRKYTLRILYSSPIFLIVVFTLLKFAFDYPSNQANFFISGAIAAFSFYLFMISLIIGFISLFKSYLKLEKERDRNAIFIILISYALGLGAMIYTLTVANVVTDLIFNSPEHFAPIILIAIIPVSFGYSIYKYSLMDVSDVLKKAIMYGAATIIIAAVYFFVIYLVGQSLSMAIGTQYQGIIAGIIFIAFALLFQSTKDKFQEIITRKFYPEQFSYQKVLIKFSNDISTIVGLENILESTFRTFVDSIKSDKFGIVLKSTSGKYELRKNYKLLKDDLNLTVDEQKIKEFISYRESIKQQPVIENKEFEDLFPENAQLLKREKIYTIIPLIIKSKIIGFLLFGLKYSGAQFSGKDLELLVAASNQTALSIENARLYESEAQKMKMDRDLENARLIQQSLLPKKIPDIHGLSIAGKMIPAMQIGGDYYDLIKISDDKIFVVIGDVSGKGLSASFYMSKLQTMMRLYCTDGKSPKEILTEINKRFYESIDRRWFITISIGLFDLSKNTMSFCRAGHTPLIHVKAREIYSYQSGGIGVGLEMGDIFEESLEEIEIPFNKNELFVFYSDGINEAMNSNNDFYGLQRLEERLKVDFDQTPQYIMNGIINSVEKFKGNAEQNDDITLVVVKIK
ncbi:MAG: SpoIIE family protein phosphatase [Melioribacteraceae bacterium]|nr:SpoIIE family protein phosphatase [Melioribacteraceae bacterium]MCF8355335.1 SpoIIE family protein phosphatase [Melioribacteraceae bacterium]MCF8392351.1 SpoIIE family protein phosphatase [Melioribacteraceae bacterium]MCF8417871.1 SpoIIE family protein phosphatase [Melioribacteraceae bacterium]